MPSDKFGVNRDPSCFRRLSGSDLFSSREAVGPLFAETCAGALAAASQGWWRREREARLRAILNYGKLSNLWAIGVEYS